MKQICMLALVVLVFACRHHDASTQESIAISAIVDITDSHQVKPDAQTILTLCGLGNQKKKAVFFRLLPGTDKVLNPVVAIHLPDERTTDRENKQEIPHHRERVIKKFYGDVRKAIADFNAGHAQDTILSHSECFAAIASELTIMKKYQATENVLLLYSDLAENSGIFNAYSPHGSSLLQSNPNAVIRIFEQTKLLPDSLQGFRIIARYNPRSREDDIRFRKMAAVYTKLFETRGVTFTIEANN